jgi:D-alanyl-D-alanine carboxypeptidase/D-alanyl-D-alanine-endopeptidase (penicillin-binding protein 4)
MTKSIRVTIQSFCSLFMLSALTLAPSSSAFAKKSKAHSRSAQPAVSLVDIPTSDSELAKKISARLHKMVEASKLNSADLGIWVGRTAEQGLETLYSHDAGRSMIPASLSKLATLATVLHELRPGYKFKTQLMSDAQIESGKLMGSIYLVGGGDPSFVSEDMWLLVNDLTHAGITSIDGDVVVDDSRFDKVRFGPDRQKERVDRAYDAPIGAMSMNWNSVNIYARPGDSVGEKLRVSVDVTTPYLTIKNETKTVASGHGQNVSVERATAKNGMGEEITIRGSMARGQPEVAIFKSITSPDLFSGYNLIEFLKQRGISVKGGVKLGKTPASGQVLATFEGKPLAHVVTDMAKWSNNFVAEMLVKNLSAEAGAWHHGRRNRSSARLSGNDGNQKRRVRIRQRGRLYPGQ